MMQFGKSAIDGNRSTHAGVGEDWLDRAALTASTVCLIHCLLLPLALAALPALEAAVGARPWFHQAMLLLIVPVSGFALLLGWKRRRVAGALLLGLLGLACLAVGVAIGESVRETVVTIAGSLLLASAHIVNWRSRRRGDCALHL